MDPCHQGIERLECTKSSSSWLSSLICFIAAISVIVAIQAGGRAAVASADTCSWTGSNWNCFWEANLAPYQNRYFNAVNPLRNWFKAGVGDAYGGAVAAKCVYVLNSAQTSAVSVACGSGFPKNTVPTSYRPGYLYISHWASGARTISGSGAH